MGSSGYVHIQVDIIIRETDKAFLVEVGDNQHWIPKSQIASADDYDVGDRNITVSITEYIAKQLGLEEEGN